MHYKISFLHNSAKLKILPLQLSPISILMFIFLILTASSAFAEEEKVAVDNDFKIGLKILGSVNVPLGESMDLWEPFVTGGIKVSLPVGIKNLKIHGVGEYGLIIGADDDELEIKTGLIRLQLSYSIPLKSDKFSINPFLGIMDMMIHHNEEDILESVFDTEIFKNVENEFGVSFGVEPEFNYKKFSVSLPIFYDLLFSSPKVYQSFNTSLAIGVNF